MAEDTENKKFREWFWTIFGGAMISTLAILFITVLNYLNNNIATAKSDSENNVSQIRESVVKIGQRAATMEGTLDAYTKEKTQELEYIKKIETKTESLGKQLVSLDKDQEICKERMESLTKVVCEIKDIIKEIKTDMKLNKPKE
jgi:DNA repair exonuclease SbcCD ATPase subunit